ncbi:MULTISPECIES: Na/Pi cotransporter family protein [Thiomicrorhabdus]|uniref:Na/Pi cotransporter family protein n=1 Tax=Thiomicrorhabdus heinhorstiae TaxID=2748010 RepID=A0ABS0BVB3_9GAMM|nr:MULTISPECIES: Na/Pi cotransporter family protein [Thiomicrorhabdus]MBF6057763.1 Na/Pi cotransporter family protein [Thiomicrorhabdus heinhorstiae]
MQRFIRLFSVLSSLFFLFYVSDVLAQDGDQNKLNWFEMLVWFGGGLALFLFGMEQMIQGVMSVAGNQIKNILKSLTKNRVIGALTGAGLTAIIQSSSITTVLSVGFVSAGLISLSQAAGIIMGANLGTTITGQIIAFKIDNVALLMIAVGFLMQFIGQLNKTRSIGQMLMGLGLLFFGMDVMSQGMAPLRSYAPFLELMTELQNPLFGILVGLVFTALVQSSSATIGIVIAMAGNGLLTLPVGIALIMGANIGTTITAMLATIGKSRDALRAGLIHLFFNLLAVLIWLAFIPELANFATMISDHELLTSTDDFLLLAENTPREIANANTILNLFSLIVFLPTIPLFVWLVTKIVPVIEDEKAGNEIKAESLDESFISTSSLALEAVVLELGHYDKHQDLFYKRVVGLISDPKLEKLRKETEKIQKFRAYQRQIISYLGRIGQESLTPKEQQQQVQLMMVIHSLESMMDAIEHNIFHVLHRLIQNDIKPSETMLNLVGQLTSEVGKAMTKSVHSIIDNDNDAAISVIAVEATVEHLIQEALNHQLRHFQPTEERLGIFRYEMELIEGFKQLYSLAKRIAHLRLEIDPNAVKPESAKIS